MSALYSAKTWQEDLKTLVQLTDVKTLVHSRITSIKLSKVQAICFHKGGKDVKFISN